MDITRRGFLKGLLAVGAGLAIEEAIQVNRVYFFPKEIKLYKPEEVPEIIGRMMHFRYDVTKDQIEAAIQGTIPWHTLTGANQFDRSWDKPPTLLNAMQMDGALSIKGKPIEALNERKIILTD